VLFRSCKAECDKACQQDTKYRYLDRVGKARQKGAKEALTWPIAGKILTEFEAGVIPKETEINIKLPSRQITGKIVPDPSTESHNSEHGGCLP
jgi:hypothetical protein